MTATIVTEAVLFVRFGSGVALDTVAVFVLGPTAELPVRATTVTTALLPELRLPRLQVTGPAPEQVPSLGIAESNVMPAGIASTSVTAVAVEGPRFVTVIVKVAFVFAGTTD